MRFIEGKNPEGCSVINTSEQSGNIYYTTDGKTTTFSVAFSNTIVYRPLDYDQESCLTQLSRTEKITYTLSGYSVKAIVHANVNYGQNIDDAFEKVVCKFKECANNFLIFKYREDTFKRILEESTL